MVTLAVAAILMGFALPAFNDFLRQRTMTSGINDFVLAVTYARSEAVRRGEPVSVQAASPVADNEWGGGYCVVVGDPGNCPADVLRRFDAIDDEVAKLDSAAGVETFTFTARGLLTPQPAGPITMTLCSVDEDQDPGRAVTITVTGRPDSQENECHG